ncbi:hypothetical protein SAMN03159398_04468 [Pseudomonas sp. NFPP02]|nr:hypothetical protein SAMN03159398_04468 [Pseudomonas sp. NFPP02]
MLSWLIPPKLHITRLKSPWAMGDGCELLLRLFAHWQLDAHTYHREHVQNLKNSQSAMPEMR